MKMLLLYLIGIFIISNSLKNMFKIKEKYTIIFSTSIIFVFLYLCGLLNVLKVGIYIIYLFTTIGFIYLLYLLIKKKIKIKELLSPIFIYYVLIALVLYIITINANFTQWDEFSHWGSNLKFMFYNDNLWANKLWEGVHECYPPLAGIVEYLGLKLNNGYSEAMSFFAIDLFMLSLITPMLKNSFKLKNIIKNILFILCIYMVILIFGYGLNSLYIDLPLGILFASGLYIAIKNKDNNKSILLGLILFMLPIMKDSGLIFAGIILLYLFIDSIYKCVKEKKFDIKYFIPIIIYFLVVCLSYLSWKLYCNFNNTSIDFRHDSNAIESLNIIEYFKSLFLMVEGKNYDITLSFYNFLNNNGVISRYPFSTIIQTIVVLNIFAILMNKFNILKKEKINKLIATIDIGFIVYILFLLCVYLYALLEPEGRGLVCFSRYIGTFFIGVVIILISLCIKYKKSFIPIILSFLICLYGTNIASFFVPVPKNYDAIPSEVHEMYNNISPYLKFEDKIFIILQNDGGYNFHTLRYLLAPIQTNLLYEWNLGETNTAAELATLNLTSDEFLQELKNREYTYVYLGVVDENFVKEYGKLFNNNPTIVNLTNKLYKINYDSDNIKFIEQK